MSSPSQSALYMDPSGAGPSALGASSRPASRDRAKAPSYTNIRVAYAGYPPPRVDDLGNSGTSWTTPGPMDALGLGGHLPTGIIAAMPSSSHWLDSGLSTDIPVPDIQPQSNIAFHFRCLQCGLQIAPTSSVTLCESCRTLGFFPSGLAMRYPSPRPSSDPIPISHAASTAQYRSTYQMADAPVLPCVTPPSDIGTPSSVASSLPSGQGRSQQGSPAIPYNFFSSPREPLSGPSRSGHQLSEFVPSPPSYLLPLPSDSYAPVPTTNMGTARSHSDSGIHYDSLLHGQSVTSDSRLSGSPPEWSELNSSGGARFKPKVATQRTEEASNSRRRGAPARYQCTIDGCRSTFTKKHNLESHMRSHFDERPFNCQWCHRAFVRANDCVRHEKNHCKRRPPPM